MKKIYCIGLSTLDHNFVCEALPRVDAKSRAMQSCIHPGGPACVAALTANALVNDGDEIAVTLLSSVARDAAGNFLIRSFKDFDLDFVSAADLASSPTAAIFTLESGERSILNTEMGALQKKDFNELSEALGLADLCSSRDEVFLLCDGRHSDLLLKLQAELRQAKIPVQVILDAGSANEGILSLLPHCDWLVGSKSFALAYTQTTNIETALKILESEFSQFCITLGPEGYVFKEKPMQSPVSCEAKKTLASNSPYSSSCGDVFHGAFVLALAEGKGAHEAFDSAAIFAARKTHYVNLNLYLESLTDV